MNHCSSKRAAVYDDVIIAVPRSIPSIILDDKSMRKVTSKLKNSNKTKLDFC